MVTHTRIRPFNTRDTYPEQNLDNDLCQAVVANGVVYLRGQIGQDPETRESVGIGDVEAQAEQAMANIAMLLEEAGSSLEDVVSATVYLTAASDFQPMNAAYREFWTVDPPTRTTVITTLVRSEALVEISMIAVPGGAERVVVLPEGWMKSPHPYSYGIRCGDTLFLSGLVPRRGRDRSAGRNAWRVWHSKPPTGISGGCLPPWRPDCA